MTPEQGNLWTTREIHPPGTTHPGYSAPMATMTYTLRYDGQEFGLTEADHKRLSKAYKQGYAISGILFAFTPIGSTDEVEIGIGSGAQFVITKHVTD